ncbi:MAG: HAD family phosphatase [Sphingomonadales bacterium]|nr:HAD family phosphatase [Sphingomonadales bacterium]
MTTAQKPNAVVFDVGNVLVSWDPRNLYKKHIADEDELNWFLSEVVNLNWHTAHDKGLSFADGCANRAEIFPKYKDLIYLFHSHWRETIAGPIGGSVALLRRLSENRVPLYALSNYSAETFPDLLAEFAFMGLFDDILISGSVGHVKPEAEIYKLAMARFKLAKGQALFVDDRQENIDAGAAHGLLPHLFTSPESLELELTSHGLL